MSGETGTQALAGEEEHIKGVKLFPAVNNERKIEGRGKSIIVYDPNAPMDTSPYWEHHDSTTDGTGTVPAGYVVRVIGAFVKFT
ncbi:hypothetical protein B0O99DRAFT_159658 [Bisporella sp. PMI_857]|nr:hypothetical protein B0O99DRAFT_159658 [Bisporella sp. PMI_857]